MTFVDAPTRACNCVPDIGSSSSFVLAISARNWASFIVASNPARNIRTVSAFKFGGAMTERPTAPLAA